MGRRGPEATPSPLRPVPDRRPGREPIPRPVVGDPAPPAWLEGRAQELWDEWAPLAADMGMLSSVDVARFAMGCQAMADYEHARRLLARGWTTTGQKGARVVSPAVLLMRDAETRYDRFCARFGFDPSSRATLKVAPPMAVDRDSPFDVRTRRVGMNRYWTRTQLGSRSPLSEPPIVTTPAP